VTWLSWHEISERRASEAHAAARVGDLSRAMRLFREAAEAECKALDDLDSSKARTYGITAVSAVSLWFKSESLAEAEKTAIRVLGSGNLPAFATGQLRELVQSIWTAQALRDAGVRIQAGQIVVSIKGGQTIVGGAPLDVITEKVQAVEALFYRTIEFLMSMPHRKRGGPPSEIQQLCRPWIFQMQPGSYQFSVAIERSRQLNFFDEGPPAEQISAHFLSILRATSEDPVGQLEDLIPAKDYRGTFLKLARNLAPSAKHGGTVEVREAREVHGIFLGSETRKNINSVLRASTVAESQYEPAIELHGVLRALHLDRDWLELWDAGKTTRITGLAEAVDDVIGPMVNRRVVVQARRDRRSLVFVDIEPEE
jgi:hypothetical protein